VYLGTVAPILLGFSLLWFIPLLGYLFASYRPGFFSMVYPEVLALLSAGMAALLGEFRSLWPKAALRPSLFTSILLLLLAVGGNLEYGGEQALGWLRTRRTNPDLQWVGALSQNIPRGSCIISYDTSDAIYANLLPNSDWMTYFETHSPSDLSEFMQTQNCHYVEVDSDLTTYAPGYAKLVEGSLVLKFSSADGTRRVYSDRP